MTSIVKLEALSGVQDDGPLCYLLQVDQVCILLDCGWDERFEMGYIEAVKRRVPQINAVLLSYGDVAHIGALPYLIGKCGLKCPIYATLPVCKMGQLFLQDWLLGHKNVEEFSLFEIGDIQKAFEMIEYVKFGQVINLKGDNGLQVMPLLAGHMLGGALWRITKEGDEEIVYAVDFNLRKERHLNACTFDGVGRPNLFITDAFSALYNQPKPKTRDENLLSKLITTLREGGDAMIVIDTAGRVLEIAYMLEALWQNRESGLTSYNLVLLNYVAASVVETAKSLSEFMSDKLLRLCEAGRPNPFDFSYLRCCHSLNELSTIRSPKVVLTSGLDMDTGFSRELFLEWCADSKNIVIVTGRSNERSLGSKLIRMAEARDQKKPTTSVVTLAVKRRIRLEGAELEAYMICKKEKEEAEAKQRLENVRRNIRIEQTEDSDESDDDLSPGLMDHGRLLNSLDNKNDIKPDINFGYDIMTRFEQNQKTSFFKRNRKQFPMFPHIEEKTRWDDYGQIIRPEDYTLIESNKMHQNPAFNHFNRRKPEIKEEDEESNVSDTEIVIDLWPTKCISYVEKIEVFCKLAYIDFEGRTDGDSIKKVINQIRPKQLVLVHGSAPATRALSEYCQQNANLVGFLIGDCIITEPSVQEKTFTPLLGETVDLTIESHIFQVTLSDPLMSSLNFQSVRDAELCWVDARLKKRKIRSIMDFSEMDESDLVDDAKTTESKAVDNNGTAEKSAENNKNGNGEQATNEPEHNIMEVDEDGEFTPKPVRMNTTAEGDQLCLEVLPSNNIPSHEAVFVNDPKLSDLRLFLNKSGFSAEFSAGVLYVNDVLRISRNEAGKFELEGVFCEDYITCRDAIYSQFAIV